MKQKDLITVLAAGIFSVIVSFILAKVLISPGNMTAEVPVVPAISTNFPSINTQYFNNSSIDPTQIVRIGSGNNTTPFSDQ